MPKLTIVAFSLFGATAFAAPAFAGGCPADKQVPSGQGQPMSDAKAAGVTNTVVASIDVANEPVHIPGRLFRLRKLTIAPGGVVPWHDHSNRPAIITIISGQIVEYASDCAIPLVHKAGDSIAELHTTQHWWKNLGKKPVVLYSADLFPTGGKADSHMM